MISRGRAKQSAVLINLENSKTLPMTDGPDFQHASAWGMHDDIKVAFCRRFMDVACSRGLDMAV